MVVFGYFLIGFIYPPQKCAMPDEATGLSVRYQASHVDAPFVTALASMGTLYIKPSCYAPVTSSNNRAGWTYEMTGVVRQLGYEAYLMWLRILCGVLAFNALWFSICTLWIKRELQ